MTFREQMRELLKKRVLEEDVEECLDEIEKITNKAVHRILTIAAGAK